MAVEFKRPTQEERLKYTAAADAGLLDRVLEAGWAGLSAKESGRIGGMISQIKRRKDNHVR